jgi:hypothetical protein
MTRQRAPLRLIAPAAALGVCLAAAAPATADDASLFAAYNARQMSELPAASDAYERAFAILERTKARRGVRAVMRANRRINRVLTAIERDLNAQAPSSEPGTRARRAAVREVRGWRRANRYENRGWRVGGRGDDPRPLLRRAGKEMLRAMRHGRRAVRRFAAVGLSSPYGPVTKKP